MRFKTLMLHLLTVFSNAFVPHSMRRSSFTTTSYAISPCIPIDYKIILEPAAKSLLDTIKQDNVPITNSSVLSSYAFFPSTKLAFPSDPPPSYSNKVSLLTQLTSIFSKRSPISNIVPPIVLIHGFDSSCLEFRRLAPLLAQDRDVYAVDILGWGFNDHTNITDFSPAAKISHLKSFLNNVVKTPCVLVGASLGGAIAIITATESPTLVKKVVLIDAQGFIDGKGPSDIPDIVAKFGVKVLKSEPLRMYANFIAYFDKKFATKDAMQIGRLHCLRESWERASVSFLKSGGFVMSSKVPLLTQPTLVLWGANDEILDPATLERFRSELPNPTVEIIPECGHVPHLEKPQLTASSILSFLNQPINNTQKLNRVQNPLD